MLKPIPFANAFGLTTALFYLVLWVLNLVAPTLFTVVYNAQFLSGNAAQALAPVQQLGTSLINLVVVTATGWVMGYIVAKFYNYFSKNK